jgi:8-hydroxy-5-deazaflavin:NADPH oxidoreductase
VRYHQIVNHSRVPIYAIVAAVLLSLGLGLLPRAARAQPATSPIKIATVGSGNIGSTVGGFWIKAGHPVMFSSRHPEELKSLVDRLGPLARAGTVRDALAFGDVILMAVPYGAYPQVAKDYAKDFTGKIMVDAGNAVIARDGEIAKPARENGVGLTTAKLFPGARVVRAFNILGTGRLKEMANHSPRFAIPVAGDDQEALKVVIGLVREAGFEPVVVGSLERSKLFEQTGPLYGAQMSADEMREKLKTLIK